MGLAIIQGLWIGKKLSVIERLCITSFLKNGHEFHLYTYEPIENLPAGVVIKDANEIIASSKVFTYTSSKSYAGFADWFRWELLYQKGNYWVDMDMICIKPIDLEDEIVYGRQDGEIGVSILKFPKGHQIPRMMSDVSQNPNKFMPYDRFKDKRNKLRRIIFYLNDRSKIHWGEAGGPQGFTKAAHHLSLYDIAKPFTYFYPVGWQCWDTIYDETFKNDFDLFRNTYAIHLWNECGRRKPGFNKSNKFSDYSLIEDLKRRYDVHE